MQNCYIFVATQVTWQAAEDDCVAQGAHLVSIHSQAEQDFVAGENSKYWFCCSYLDYERLLETTRNTLFSFNKRSETVN